MRYAAGAFYALAIAAHSGALLNTLMLGGLIFAGVVCTLFAVEGIVKDALTPKIGTLEAMRIASAEMQRRDHLGMKGGRPDA